MTKYLPSLLIFAVFFAVGLILFATLNNLFYLFNFAYIGVCVSLALAFIKSRPRAARRVAQFGIGIYMLVILGFLFGENMNLSGFWYYLFLGVFEGAVIHYLVAKIAGPLIFGRGWCGYACWTAMILDLLPWKVPTHTRKNRGFMRVLLFTLILAFSVAVFILDLPDKGAIMFWAFIFGNIAYYCLGILLAYLLKDNRAFCKYICPITVFLKPMSYFSLLRVKVDAKKCISCGRCVKVCPMNVNLLDPKRNRENGTECILCMECIHACKNDAVKL